MSQLSKNLMCISLRNGVEFWVEDDRAKNLKQILLTGDQKFIELDGELFNRADIVGVFSANTMADHTRRKNGEWKCGTGTWHKRKQDCDCYLHLKNGACEKCHVHPCVCDWEGSQKK